MMSEHLESSLPYRSPGETQTEPWESRLSRMEQMLHKTGKQTDAIFTCLKGNDLGTPGLIAEIADLKKRITQMDTEIITAKVQAAKFTGGVIAICFLIEQGVRFIFPSSIK